MTFNELNTVEALIRDLLSGPQPIAHRNNPPPNPLPIWEGELGLFKKGSWVQLNVTNKSGSNWQIDITDSPPFLGEGLGEGLI